MDPLTIGLSALPSAISGITGVFQKAKARKLEKRNIRPIKDIPTEIKTNQLIAQQQSTLGLPGAQLMHGYQNIARYASNALGAAQNRRSGLAAIGAIQQGTNDASLGLTVSDAQARVNNIRNLMLQNSVMATYRDSAWQWNNQQKYLENAAAIRALKGAGNANINTAIDGLTSVGLKALKEKGGGNTGEGFSMMDFTKFRQRGF